MHHLLAPKMSFMRMKEISAEDSSRREASDKARAACLPADRFSIVATGGRPPSVRRSLPQLRHSKAKHGGLICASPALTLALPAGCQAISSWGCRVGSPLLDPSARGASLSLLGGRAVVWCVSMRLSTPRSRVLCFCESRQSWRMRW